MLLGVETFKYKKTRKILGTQLYLKKKVLLTVTILFF